MNIYVDDLIIVGKDLLRIRKELTQLGVYTQKVVGNQNII